MAGRCVRSAPHNTVAVTPEHNAAYKNALGMISKNGARLVVLVGDCGQYSSFLGCFTLASKDAKGKGVWRNGDTT